MLKYNKSLLRGPIRVFTPDMLTCVMSPQFGQFSEAITLHEPFLPVWLLVFHLPLNGCRAAIVVGLASAWRRQLTIDQDKGSQVPNPALTGPLDLLVTV